MKGELFSLDLKFYLAHGRKKDNQPHTITYTFFKLQEDENILSITHEQETTHIQIGISLYKL